jgi:addiction module HigA family antidote
MRDLPPVHPGEHLREDFMVPLRLTAYGLAQSIGVPTTRIQAIITGRRGISGDTALRLARYFDTTPEFWMNLQRDYELENAEIEAGSQIEEQVRVRAG